MKKSILLIALIFLFSNTTFATDYWVATWGSNTAGTGSAANPWASLSYASTQATSFGDKIQINPGVYTDNNQCALSVGVHIEGAGKDVVTIHSSYNGWYILGESSPVTNGSHNISGFTLDGNGKTLAHGIRFFGRTHVQVHHIEVREVDSFGIQILAINTQDAITPPSQYITNIEINNCTVTNCGRVFNNGEYASSCISIGHLQNSYIHDNYISDNIGGGIIFWGWGWFKSLQVYNNNINISGMNSIWGSQSAIELWHLFDDCQVYNNTTNNWISLVYGNKGIGNHSVEVFDNRVLFTNPLNPKEGVELGLGLYDSEIHHNYIENGLFGVAIWGVAPGEPGLWPVSNISIHHNVFYTTLEEYSIAIFINPSDMEVYDDIRIFNNVFEGYEQGVQLKPRPGTGQILNTTIRNNLFLDANNAVVCDGFDDYQSTMIQNTIVDHNIYQGDNILLETVATTNPSVTNNIFAAAQINGSGSRPSPYYLANSGNANIVDAGVNVGFAYEGSSPDIGAYEYGAIQPTIQLNLKALLQGPYDESSQIMTDNLRITGVLPINEPYTALGYAPIGGGGEMLGSNVLATNGNNAIVDWVLIELRNANAPSTVIATRSALVQRDGDIVSADGSPLVFDVASLPAEVVIAMRHRNHFGVRTSNAYPTSATIVIDFTNPSTPVYGANPMTNVAGKMVLIAGDANRDGQINGVDRNGYWRPQNSNPYNYMTTLSDFNLDGQINGVDLNSKWRINNTKVEQLD